MKRVQHQQGFIHLTTVLVLVLITVIGGVGYYVWQINTASSGDQTTNQSKNSEPTAAADQTSTASITWKSFTSNRHKWSIENAAGLYIDDSHSEDDFTTRDRGYQAGGDTLFADFDLLTYPPRDNKEPADGKGMSLGVFKVESSTTIESFVIKFGYEDIKTSTKFQAANTEGVQYALATGVTITVFKNDENIYVFNSSTLGGVDSAWIEKTNKMISTFRFVQ